MCDKPLRSVLAAVGGGGLGGLAGVLGGLGAVETAVLAGLVAGAADVGAHVAAGDPAVAPLVDRLPTGLR